MSYPTPGPACQHCHAQPAMKIAFQSITGMLVMYTIRTVRGVYCRDCGLAIQKQMNSKTLAGGWFSIGSLVGMPIILSINAARAGRLKKLPAPVRTPAYPPAQQYAPVQQPAQPYAPAPQFGQAQQYGQAQPYGQAPQYGQAQQGQDYGPGQAF